MNKPHIKRVLHRPYGGGFVWGWGLWRSKESYKSGNPNLVWSKDLDRIKAFYFARKIEGLI